MDEAVSTASVAGLVLAAGRSTRMGRSKPLLDLGGRTFLAATVEALLEGGCAGVVAVVAGEEAAAEARSAGARAVEGRPDGEQVDSLRAGLDAMAAGTTAALVLPVDHPLVATATVRALLEASAEQPGAVIRPVHEGRPGHPTLFPADVWGDLRDPGLGRGARSIVEGGDARVVDVPVADAGVVADIDTPADYDRIRQDPT